MGHTYNSIKEFIIKKVILVGHTISLMSFQNFINFLGVKKTLYKVLKNWERFIYSLYVFKILNEEAIDETLLGFALFWFCLKFQST